MNKITSLIDGDSLFFIISWNLKEIEDIDICYQQVDTFVYTILNKTNATAYIGFLGGCNNFRKTICSEYKSNRGERPEWVQKWEPHIRQRLIDKWKFVVCENIEAEDGLVIASEFYKDKTNLVYCHIDKDLNFLEGNHFNFSKHEFWYTDKIGSIWNKKGLKGTGLKFYYAQLICGDSTDGIKGLVGKGVAFAVKLLENCNTEYSMFRAVYKAYLQHSNRESFIRNRHLVRMLDTESYDFIIPNQIEYKKVEINIFEL